MKKLIGLLLLLGAVFAGGPFVSGMLVEQRYQELLSEGAFESSMILQAESYERGWFSSRIVTEVEVTEPQIVAVLSSEMGRAVRPVFRVESVVHHGPAWLDGGFGMGLARVDTHLILNDEDRAKLAVLEGAAVSMQTTVHFGRSAAVSLDLSEGRITSESGETMVVHPVSSSWLISDLGNRIRGEATWSGMDMTGGKADAHIAGAVIKTSMERHANLWIGDMVWDQGEMLFDGPGKRAVFKGIHFDTTSGLDASGELVEGDMNMTIQSVDVAGEGYGPGVYRMSVANLPLDTLVKIQEIQNQMARVAMGNVDRQAGLGGPALAGQIMMLLPELLSRGPVIEISELKMATPHGEVKGSLKISLPESAPEKLMNPQYLKQVLRADIDLTVPAVYFSSPQAAQAAYNYTQSGLIERNGDMLHSTLHLADGQLTINGKPVPLPF